MESQGRPETGNAVAEVAVGDVEPGQEAAAKRPDPPVGAPRSPVAGIEVEDVDGARIHIQIIVATGQPGEGRQLRVMVGPGGRGRRRRLGLGRAPRRDEGIGIAAFGEARLPGKRFYLVVFWTGAVLVSGVILFAEELRALIGI